LIRLDTNDGALRRPEQVFDEAYYASYGVLTAEWRRELFIRRLAEISKLTQGRRLLDVGAALGHLVKRAADCGFSAVGVEPSVWRADYARRVMGVDVRTGVLEEVPLPAGSFDVVHVNHVLENIPDPRPMLRQIATLLSPEGILYLSVPNVNALARWFCDPYEWYVPQYRYYEFSRRTIVRLVAQCGLQVMKSWTMDGTFNYRYWLTRNRPAAAAMPKTAAPAAQGAVKRLVDGLVSTMGRGQSIIVIARICR